MEEGHGAFKEFCVTVATPRAGGGAALAIVPLEISAARHGSICWILFLRTATVRARAFRRRLPSSQESGMTLITAEDLDDAAEKAVKASVK
uniref:Uncharacterized protein n=1 Tax=Leersia perrieri TaxID=77586 RepID=A0A0D9VIG9_9ORYZ